MTSTIDDEWMTYLSMQNIHGNLYKRCPPTGDIVYNGAERPLYKSTKMVNTSSITKQIYVETDVDIETDLDIETDAN